MSLRERRRKETLREVSEAAITLFEQHGVAGTTVDDIAHEAGISPRTFFRYFPTKEHAAFLEDDDVDEMIESALSRIEAGSPAEQMLDEAWREIMLIFDGDATRRATFLRFHRLLQAEPALLAIALQRDAERVAAMADRITHTGTSQFGRVEALTLLELFGTIARVTFHVWAESDNAEQQPRLTLTHRRVRAAALHTARALAGDAG